MSSLVGQYAPDFDVTAVQKGESIEHFTLSQFRDKRYVVLFFYPFDFTFVCPTELHEFQHHLATFQQLGAEVIAASADSAHSHKAWLEKPKSEGGIQGVQYPILADFNKKVAQAYGVLLPEGMPLRGTFLIDKKGIVQAQVVNNLALGRNIEDTLRLLQALQYTEKHGEVCSAGWNDGQKGIKASHDGVKKYFASK